MIRIIEFVKLGNKWYADLPEWEGDTGDLQMVGGADTFLNIFRDRRITLIITDEPNENAEFKLILEDVDSEGATYKVESKHYSGFIWLCNVTLTIFKEFPRILYYARIN